MTKKFSFPAPKPIILVPEQKCFKKAVDTDTCLIKQRPNSSSKDRIICFGGHLSSVQEGPWSYKKILGQSSQQNQCKDMKIQCFSVPAGTYYLSHPGGLLGGSPYVPPYVPGNALRFMWCQGLKLRLANAIMHPILSPGFRSIFCENIKQYFVDTLRGGQ